jgi:hypothetical protein
MSIRLEFQTPIHQISDSLVLSIPITGESSLLWKNYIIVMMKNRVSSFFSKINTKILHAPMADD